MSTKGLEDWTGLAGGWRRKAASRSCIVVERKNALTLTFLPSSPDVPRPATSTVISGIAFDQRPVRFELHADLTPQLPCQHDAFFAARRFAGSCCNPATLQPTSKDRTSINLFDPHRARCNGFSTPTPVLGGTQVLDSLCVCFFHCGCSPLPPRIPRPHPRSKCPPESRPRRSTAAEAKGAHAAHRPPYEDVGT